MTRKDHSEKWAAQAETADLLDAGDLIGAVRHVSAYELRQLIPRGMNVDWASGTAGLSRIIDIYHVQPWFLQNVNASNQRDVRLLAAMDELWGERVKIFPTRNRTLEGCKFDMETASRQLQFYVSNKEMLDQAKHLTMPYLIEYLATWDACPSCKTQDGKLYNIDNVPAVPLQECSCPTGCRCTLGIKINDGIDDY